MSHQGRSPDNPLCWSCAKAAQGEEKSSTANRACSQGCRGVTWAFNFLLLSGSVGLQLPSLAPSLLLPPLVCYLNPLDCRAGSRVWHAVVPASRFEVSTTLHRSGLESRL